MSNVMEQPCVADNKAATSVQGATELRGQMGVFSLMMTVLAFSAPVVVVASFIPFVIGFAGGSAPVAYLLAMLILLVFAVGFTTMSRYVKNPGAFYSYICAGIGKRTGLGACFLAIGAYFGLGVGTYVFFGFILNDLVSRIVGYPVDYIYPLTYLAIAVVGLLGYMRIELSAKVLTVAMLCEILIVAVFDACVFVSGGASGVSFESLSIPSFFHGEFGLPVVFAATCFLGFEATAVFRDEVKNPSRTVPLAAYLCVATIGVFYILSTWALVTAYGVQDAQAVANKNFETMFVSAVGNYVGAFAEDVVVVLIVTSAFACVLALQNILSRYFFSLGVDGVINSAFGKIHCSHGSPFLSSVLVTVTTLLLVGAWSLTDMEIAPSYALLAGTGGYVILILMLLTGISVASFFIKNAVGGSKYSLKTFWAPMAAAVLLGAVIANATINFSHIVGDSGAKADIALSLIGILFAAGWLVANRYKRSKPVVYAKIGRQSPSI